MGGIASALGGFGNAAAQYGQQMRGILESRRHDFVSLALQRAQEEDDPTMRDQWSSAAADALAGKDFGKILPSLIKAHDNHQQSTQALGQIAQSVIPQQSKTPAPPPGPAQPGQVPGTTPQAAPSGAGGFLDQLTAQNFKPEQPQIAPNLGSDTANLAPPPGGGAMTTQPAVPPAAQTTQTAVPTKAQPIKTSVAPAIPSIAAATAPISALAAPPTPQAAPPSGLPEIPGLPVAEDPQKIRDETFSNPMWHAPANRPAMLAVMNQRLQHQEALRQALETQQATLAYKRAAVAEVLKQNPNLPEAMKASLVAEAGGLPGLQLGAYLRPINTPSSIPASTIPDEYRLDIHGQPIDARSSPYVREHRDLLTGTTYYSPATGPVQTVVGNNGQMTNVARVPGDLGGALPLSYIAPKSTGFDNSGHQVITSPFDIAHHLPPLIAPGVATAYQPMVSSHSTTEFKDINGQIVPVVVNSSTQSRRGGGASAPVIAAPGSTPAVAPLPGHTATTPPHAGSGFRVGEPLGASQGTFNMEAQNPLTAEGQKVMTTTTPVLQLMDRVKAALQPFKDDKTPGTLLLPRIAYALGFPNQGALLSALELSDIGQAGAALHNAGIRSNLQTLNRAIIHTPDAWKDSGALMIDKIDNIEKNIRDVQGAVKQYEQKFPGLNRQAIQPIGGGGNAAVPTHRFDPATGTIVAVP